MDELTAFIGAADIYITPYLNEAQITSGTLAYCFGAGKAIVSTPYWHAVELLANGRGILVPFNDPPAIARAVSQLLDKETKRHAMRKTAYMMGRKMIWSNIAHSTSPASSGTPAPPVSGTRHPPGADARSEPDYLIVLQLRDYKFSVVARRANKD